MRSPVARAVVAAAEAGGPPPAAAATEAAASAAASCRLPGITASRSLSLLLSSRLDEAAAAPVLEPPRPDQVDRDGVGADSAVRVAPDMPAAVAVGLEDRRVCPEGRYRIPRPRVRAVVGPAGVGSADRRARKRRCVRPPE